MTSAEHDRRSYSGKKVIRMKKIASVILVFVMILACLSLSGCGDGEDAAKKYNLEFVTASEYAESESDKDVLVQYCKEKGYKDEWICKVGGMMIPDENDPEIIEIPAEYKGRRVVAVDGKNAKRVLASELPEGIEYLYNCGFSTSDGVFTIPESVVMIDDSFNGVSLNEVVFMGEPSVEGSFWNTSGLSKVTFEKNCKVIDDSFTDCQDLERAEFKGEVEKVMNSFNNCPKLCEIADVERINSLGRAFIDCGLLSLNEPLNEYIPKIKDTVVSSDAGLPEDPKFVFYDSNNKEYVYPYQYHLYDYGAKTPEEVNLIVYYSAEIREDGEWVSRWTGEYVKDAKSLRETITIKRLDNGNTVTRKTRNTQLDPDAKGLGEEDDVSGFRSGEVEVFLNDYLKDPSAYSGKWE